MPQGEYEQLQEEKKLLEAQNVEANAKIIDLETKLRAKDAELAKLKALVEAKKRVPKVAHTGIQTMEPYPHIVHDSLMMTPRSPLSVTDCERPPITLIVSSQSLREQYEEAVSKQQRRSSQEKSSRRKSSTLN